MKKTAASQEAQASFCKDACVRNSQRGFTLIEMVIVIVITGIVAAGVAVFIQLPVKGYVDSVSRAELTDEADTAVRRMSRDLRLALPNSILVSGDKQSIEFLLTRTGGRYLDEEDGVGGDILDFSPPGDNIFTVVGAPPPACTSDCGYIVIYNLGQEPADAYCANPNQCNRAKITSIAGQTVTLDSNPFMSQTPSMRSPSHRFQVVSSRVRYVCGGGSLTRYSDSDISVSPVGGAGVLASNVTGCQFDYGALANVRSALVSIRLSLARGESGTVTLFHQLHVDNTP